ncbi:PKD-like family lipoprotein [Thalassobellus citreus]|uniref:PKD-like family lipoprotein n=1 Tax=Thalassobellus citreus TaxID=3367752 RepID=UPI00379389AF
MQNIKIFFKPFIIGVFTLFIINSCSNDTDYVEPFDDINILLENVKDTYFYNETLLLDPAITYGENSVDDTTFSYKWNLVKESGVELISESKSLEYQLNTIGQLNIQLLVENNETHVIESQVVTIDVQAVTNKGWYVLKETTEGNTELDAFYIDLATPDYNILEQKTGAALSGAPKVLTSMGRYNENYQTVTTMQVFSEHDGVELNLKEAKLSSKLDDMFLLIDNKAEPNIQSGIVNRDIVYLSMGDYGTSYMRNTDPAFFPPIEGDYRIDGQMTMASFGNVLAFDNKNKRFIRLIASYDSFYTLGEFADAYTSYNNGVEVSVNNMNGESIFLENTQKGSGWEATTYAYSLFKKDGIDDALTLYGLDYETFVKGSYWAPDFSVIESGDYSPINLEKTLTSTDYPMLVSSDVYTMNKQVDILYFAKDNVIGAYNINDESYNPSFVNDIPADETITFMKYINTSYWNYDEFYTPVSIDLEFNGLVVATYNQASDTYKIYRYQLDGLTTISKQDDIKTGTGKVSKVMYISTSNDWLNDIHLYN